MAMRPAAGARLRLLFGVTATTLAIVATPAVSEARDRDRDGLSDRFELRKSHTSPRRADTDRDGLRDRVELRRTRTNPRKADTDRDRLSDGYEVRVSRTNPRRPDTDGDLMTDGYEVRVSRTNPRVADVYGGGLGGSDDLLGGLPDTDPPLPDTDPPLPELPLPDLLPPDTAITGGPSGTVATDSASFEFASSESDSTFACRLDGGAWSACSSPKAYADLADGAHTFSVRATDEAGNTDLTPASRTWTVDVPVEDTTPPNTTINGGPSGTVSSGSANFEFSSSESGSSFACRMDSGAWAACTSPKAYSGLADGSHTFSVRATDAAGNTDGSPASRTWTVASTPPPDTTPPNTTISSGPSGTVSSGSASFAFSSSESGSSFACRMDAGAWGACTSPKAYSGLADGSHTFSVRATDAAGNTDASPASRTWTVASDPPPTGTGCMADPSSCGYPDVETTGVTPGTTLTAVNGTVTLSTAGQVYENKLVRGSINVTAPNVTIRNVKLISTDDWYAIRAFGWSSNVSNLLLDHVEIDLGGHYDIKGIAFDNYTARNVFFHNGSDCAHMQNNVTIVDSLCVSGPDTNGDAWPDNTSFCSGPEHFDGFQSDGGQNLTIRHNTIRIPCGQTSAILMSTNTSGIRDVRIQDNLLGGGGYTLYCNAGPDVPNETVTGNRFSKRWYSQSGYYGAVRGCQDADVYSGSIWDETGAPL